MNVALEQTDEYIDGTFRKKYGDCYIRGNNGIINIYLFYSIIFNSSINYYICIYTLFFWYNQIKEHQK